ncbi:sugar phosphate isomerase/epimerase family protein [Sphingobium algorifonticola]|uniref:Sugar phosphate isomerase/epimerase n=1 Tax=Sphingobium algorifonticola TaxID=2008318 RepID=A0A437JC37_9SPHN|nr:sugar phosphate isomerase/epimerase [Sphingobium algorifonticola]RVT43467.1 sugar phosphate isomerase/epimerase [Sphingobium algorifonticola]
MFINRRSVLQAAGYACLCGSSSQSALARSRRPKPKVIANLYAYYDAHTVGLDPLPGTERAIRELAPLGYDGFEFYSYNMRQPNVVSDMKRLGKQFGLPLTGCTYNEPMWDKARHSHIVSDVTPMIERMAAIGVSTFNLNVGDAGRRKTSAELDAQADILKYILALCAKHGIAASLHNHVHEIADDMFDLRETLKRVPDLMLGPDVNWLTRAGMNPASFIEMFGSRIIYLHLRDQYADGRWTEYLGQGATDFPAIAAALDRIGFSGGLAVELSFEKGFTPTQPVWQSYAASRKYIKKIFDI